MERSLAHIALFAALIAVLGLMPRIDLISGVPITLQTFGVMLAGTVLGAKRGFLAVLLFVVLGLIGLPIFSGGRGGLGVLAGPTVGYIIGFPITAFVAGWITERWRNVPVGVAATVASIIGPMVLLSVFGALGMAYILGKSFSEAYLLTLPFLAGDAIKAVLAGFVTQTLARLRPSVVTSRA
ncbi:biotin transporter BioY [Paracoccus aminophilus]|uniref:Biotin transporter n=1 Tax=Paracoccus aminophilus JCM 7686 TaxID=1367847 RepID=S5YSA1_PARAH|nr:biotin transporter BioY [Paracoccus aminophilus]AGT08086.1 putative biotin transporter BioY [Paracoccus aminophilus JCM 7686]